MKGVTLVEMAVVMAVVGTLTALSALYVTSGDSALRSTLQQFRFDLEAAKAEAVSRKADVYVDFVETPWLDCNEDDVLGPEDRCYVLFLDLDDDDLFTPGTGEKIKSLALERSVHVSVDGAQPFMFTSLGEARDAYGDPVGKLRVRLEAAVPSNCDEVLAGAECLVKTYEVLVHSAGRVETLAPDDQQVDRERCLPLSYCQERRES